MPFRPNHALALLLLGAAGSGISGCGPGVAGPGTRPTDAAILSDRIEVRDVDERPSLTLVERHGDPKPALAVAVAHDQGAQASVALSVLFRERLAERGYPTVERQAHSLGFQLASLVSDAMDAQRFIAAARTALDTPVTENEPALTQVRAELGTLAGNVAASTAQAASAACSGELVLPRGEALIDVTQADGRAKLERWRREVVDSGHVSLAALGPHELLEQAAAAHAGAPAWPRGNRANDPWPERDQSFISTEGQIQPRIALALRLPDASRAIRAATELAAPDSRLKRQLAALVPAWTLTRSIATARVRGACLRLDLELAKGTPSTVDEVARVAFLAEREAERELARFAAAPFVLDQQVLIANDPRRAAALAAWRALIGRQPTGTPRRVLHVHTRPNLTAKAVPELEQLLTQYKKGGGPKLERAFAVEPGQGELWMLLGTRCGTLNETTATAGHGALTVQALANHANQSDDVAIEPWIAPHALGLLAHAPRRNLKESPAALARRVGRALAEALSVTPITFEETALAREQLLQAIGKDPAAAFWHTVSALSPEHPSWLSPRGTFHSLNEASRSNLEQRRQLLLSEPLRAVVIANADQQQAEIALDELERWLGPLRGEPVECAKPTQPTPALGQIEVEDGGGETRSFVAVNTPADGAAARATQYLLNRKGGWLDQALARPGLVTSAEAHLLGGVAHHALIVEVRALDGKAAEAVEQVRALFERLAQGASSAADVTLAQKRLDAEALRARLSPRGRSVELWGLPDADSTLTLQRLRTFHRALGGQNHLVVTEKARP